MEKSQSFTDAAQGVNPFAQKPVAANALALAIALLRALLAAPVLGYCAAIDAGASCVGAFVRSPTDRCASPRPARLARCSAAAPVGPRGDCCCPCRPSWPRTCPAAPCRALVRRQQGGTVAGRMEQGGRGEQQAVAQGYPPPTCVGRDLDSPCAPC